MRRSAKVFVSVIGTAVLASLAAGLAVIESPAQIRGIRLDHVKISDFRQINTAVDRYLNQTGSLPEELKTVTADQIQSVLRVKDPETHQPYEYAQTGPRNYRLCAIFHQPSPRDDDGYNGLPDFWKHDVGRQCFDIKVPEPKPK